MIFKTTDRAGLWNCLHMLKNNDAAGVELQDKQRTQQMTQWEFSPKGRIKKRVYYFLAKETGT